MKRKTYTYILLVFGLLLVGQHSFAQIIDDSTKLFYNPKTTLQLFEMDVLEGRYKEIPIDTTLNNYHNERFWYNDTSFYQHLGNIGTAAQPLLFEMPYKIGVRLGKNVFDRYAYDPYRVNYFNTRSPYTHLYYIQGGRGEQVFEALHTRNITPRLNVGVAYQIISAEQQIGAGATTRRQNGLLNNKAVKLFSHYRSKNDKYDLFANYSYMKVEQIETGGIRPGVNDTLPELLFRYEGEDVWLSQAVNREARHSFHALQIYKLAKEDLKVYHALDWRRQNNEYVDDALPWATPGTDATYQRLLFYPQALFSRTRTSDVTTYNEIENTWGMTGNNKLSSYRAYVRLRNASMDYGVLQQVRQDSAVFQNLRVDEAYNQVFVGGKIRLFYKNLAELIGEGEYQLAGDYRVVGTARIGGAYANLARVLRSPSLVERFMLSNHFIWDNDFDNSVTDRIGAGYVGKIGERQFLRLNGYYTNIKRYIYFGEEFQPYQLSGNQRFWGANLQHHIRFGALHFENFAAYTNTEEADKVRIPEWLLESKLYVETSIFKDALFSQLGMQLTMASRYYADGYMPVTQQFFVQDAFPVQGYPVFDVFLNGDIKSVNFFLKMSHVNYDLQEPVYFVTPYYPGMRRSFTFGLKWFFFD
ncbi:putative beta-barrel porin [Pontibacter ummariensis]|uniref:Putative porin n=1 Tax=Pontibacter ummariensis TaxID=1610492 RepID=A0A239BNJ1_9BACT|nr:putative porin [Pontibacter ummariensis]PRY15714.1 putative beta-barrel porin [Pontibacter ummariensis]SNS09540.1 Putative porin [Pontibacter ummariensis]